MNFRRSLPACSGFGCTPTLKAEIHALIEAAVLADKKPTGRTGMTLWQILVLGVVRLGLDADWDRMEDMANHHSLVRQMLQVPAAPWGEEDKQFGHQTLRDNVALLDDELLQAINVRIAAAGREVFAKKEGAPLAALAIKADSYVLETDVHFPTDLSLLWDSGRKCVDSVEGFLASGYALPGWRKFKDWRRQLKNLQRSTSQVVYRGGPNKEARVKKAVREYPTVGREVSGKVQQSLLELCDLATCATRWEKLEYFHRMLDKHLDLVERRLWNGETIPSHEKLFSIFEPHTEWIQKGKQRPNVELGHKLLIATDKNQLIHDYRVLIQETEVDQSIRVADRLLGRYGAATPRPQRVPCAGGLTPPKRNSKTKFDRSDVEIAGRFWQIDRKGKENPPAIAPQTSSTIPAVPKSTLFRPETSYWVKPRLSNAKHQTVSHPKLVISPTLRRYSAHQIQSPTHHVHQINFLRRGGRRHRFVLSRANQSGARGGGLRHVPRFLREGGIE